MKEPKILCFDGYNMLHRARSGFTSGDFAICYNFFRSFRALVEKFEPTRVYFVIEGGIGHRTAKDATYKANRVVDKKDLKKIEALKDFRRQKDLIINLLETCFPVSVMRHPEHECDDVIYNLIKRSSTSVPWIVASNDGDFLQLLNEFDHVKLYNPMTTKFAEKPEYDYVTWKSLRGDGSDNIKGVKGIGDRIAQELTVDAKKLQEFFERNPSAKETWTKNYDLIKFFEFSDHDVQKMTCSNPNRELFPLAIQETFELWGFKSILKDGPWQKYVQTFEYLWGNK